MCVCVCHWIYFLYFISSLSFILFFCVFFVFFFKPFTSIKQTSPRILFQSFLCKVNDYRIINLPSLLHLLLFNVFFNPRLIYFDLIKQERYFFFFFLHLEYHESRLCLKEKKNERKETLKASAHLIIYQPCLINTHCPEMKTKLHMLAAAVDKNIFCILLFYLFIMFFCLKKELIIFLKISTFFFFLNKNKKVIL